MTQQNEILVRATVNLQGIRVGQVVKIDPADPYMQMCLRRLFLVPAVPNA